MQLVWGVPKYYICYAGDCTVSSVALHLKSVCRLLCGLKIWTLMLIYWMCLPVGAVIADIKLTAPSDCDIIKWTVSVFHRGSSWLEPCWRPSPVGRAGPLSSVRSCWCLRSSDQCCRPIAVLFVAEGRVKGQSVSSRWASSWESRSTRKASLRRYSRNICYRSRSATKNNYSHFAK